LQLDWSTFLLEVINFLILVWLLKRFLYQPVLNIIEQRRRKIDDTLDQATQAQQEAQALKTQYETRLSDWQEEKRGLLEKLEQETSRERSKRLQQLDEELEQQRLKDQSRNQQLQAQWRSHAENEALQQGAAFATRLLKSLGGPELDLRLHQLFIEQLADLPQAEMQKLREGWEDGETGIEVFSAVPLDKAQQQSIRQALEQVLGPAHGNWNFSVDKALLSGLRVSAGGWMLQANLQDELRFFTESAVAHD